MQGAQAAACTLISSTLYARKTWDSYPFQTAETGSSPGFLADYPPGPGEAFERAAELFALARREAAGRQTLARQVLCQALAARSLEVASIRRAGAALLVVFKCAALVGHL